MQIYLVRVHPDLASAALEHAGREALLQLQGHHLDLLIRHKSQSANPARRERDRGRAGYRPLGFFFSAFFQFFLGHTFSVGAFQQSGQWRSGCQAPLATGFIRTAISLYQSGRGDARRFCARRFFGPLCERRERRDNAFPVDLFSFSQKRAPPKARSKHEREGV